MNRFTQAKSNPRVGFITLGLIQVQSTARFADLDRRKTLHPVTWLEGSPPSDLEGILTI